MSGNWRGAVGLHLLVALVAATPLGAARISPDPTLTLEPDRGPCGKFITARGSGFPPGSTVFLSVRRDRDGYVTFMNKFGTAVGNDGQFTASAVSTPCDAEPDGSRFTVRAGAATATYTVSTTAPLPGLPNTGQGGGRSKWYR